MDQKLKQWTKNCVKRLKLDLTSLNVFTEAATSYYAFMPTIAALANAKKVYCLARDSAYGTKTNVAKKLLQISKDFGVQKKIEIVFAGSKEVFRRTDILLNTGFIRPIDDAIINSLSSRAVISCPYEKWELRKEDVSVDDCKRKNVWVAAVDEDWDDFRIFDYVAMLALKLLFEMKLEILNLRILVVGSDKFGIRITRYLNSIGANVILKKSLKNCQAILKKSDALIVADFTKIDPIIGNRGDLTAKQISNLNPHIKILLYCGNCDLRNSSLISYPESRSYAQRMTKGFDYLGYRPLTMLQTATLKVGEILWKCKNMNVDFRKEKYKDLINFIYWGKRNWQKHGR